MQGAKYNVFHDFSFESKIIETKKGKVEYYLSEEGSTKPVVLCFHGGIGGVDQGVILLDWVDKSKYRILSVSRPGFLLTPLESGKTIEEQAELFAALLDELKIEKAVVVSASAGGPPCYTFASKFPEKTLGLISIDSVSGYYDIPEAAGAVAEKIFTTNIGQKLLNFIEDKKPEWFAKELFKSSGIFSAKQMKEHIEYLIHNETALKFLKAFSNSMNPYTPRKIGTENDIEYYRNLTHIDMKDIKCPTLIIHGTHDGDVLFSDGVYAYEHIKNAEKYWIEEGSHLGFWLNKNADAAQKTASDFLDSIFNK